MSGKLSVRGFIAVSAVAGAVLLNACGQQDPGEGDLAVTATSKALTQDHVLATGAVCTPTGKHAQHASYACASCHQCAGTLSFDASVAGANAAFDATTKNCSNVACHAVPAGTYTYSGYDWGLEEVYYVSVPYGGAQGGSAANWYAAPGAAGCSACHGYPPKYNGTAYAWHSGTHAYGVGNGNTCQLCHPDVSGAYVYGGPPSYTSTSGGMISTCAPYTYCLATGTITNVSLHGNGVVNVTPGWNTRCFGCH
jgi:hypothetical protein